MRALAWLAVCTLVACSKPSKPAEPSSAMTPDASTVTAAATPAAPEDAGLPAPEDAGSSPAPKAAELSANCRTILERYEAIQKAAPLTCKVDADCSCHLVLSRDRVLAVSDRATAAKLQSLSIAYRKVNCPTTPPAASPLCEPKCQAGKCR